MLLHTQKDALNKPAEEAIGALYVNIFFQFKNASSSSLPLFLIVRLNPNAWVYYTQMDADKIMKPVCKWILQRSNITN